MAQNPMFKGFGQLAEKMQEVEGTMLTTMQSYEQRIGSFGDELGEIRGLLRKGFRLREDD